MHQRFDAIPPTITPEDYDSVDWWSNTPVDFDAEFSSLLPAARSWHAALAVWGTADGNRFDVSRDGGKLADVFGRIDVRDISMPYVNRVVEIARRYDLLIVTEGRHVLRPSVEDLVEAIRRSPAFAFVQDPEAFLTRLAEEKEK